MSGRIRSDFRFILYFCDRGVVDHAGELVELAGAAEDVYVGVFFEDVCAVAFGHAADYAYDEVGLVGFAVAEFA